MSDSHLSVTVQTNYSVKWVTHLQVETVNISEGSVRVSMCLPPSGKAREFPVEIGSSSRSNILHYSSKSFDEKSFIVKPKVKDKDSKPCTNALREKWKAACNEVSDGEREISISAPIETVMSKYALSSDDDEPDTGLVRPELTPKNLMEEDPNRSSSKEKETQWSPPPPDDTLTIPGEPILAESREKRFSGTYWPAQVLRYVPPPDQKTPPKYTVLFMDFFEEDLPREKFFTLTNDEFVTCKVSNNVSTRKIFV
jgi:hypothetical protein